MKATPLRVIDHLNLAEVYQGLGKLRLAPDGGKTRYKIARNLRTLSDAGEALEAAKKEIDPDEDGRLQEFLRSEIPGGLPLFPIDFASLRVDENDLDPKWLAVLEKLDLLTNPPEV